MAVPVWQVLFLVAIVVISALITGTSFYSAAGRERELRQATAETYATLDGTVQSMSRQIAELQSSTARLSSRVAALEDGISILMRQIRNAGMEPDWKPDDAVMVNLPVNMNDLAAKIQTRFNLDELDDLARAIDINPEDVPGETLPRRSVELVEMAQRHGLMGPLIMACREMRPRAKW